MRALAERLDTRSIHEMAAMNRLVRLLSATRSVLATTGPGHTPQAPVHGLTPQDSAGGDRNGLLSLTFLYPMHDEEALIERAVNAATDAGNELVRSGEIDQFDILIVDDASTDGTGVLADALAAARPRVSVVHHRARLRLRGALRTGFAEADADVVLYTDADLPFDLAETAKALRIMRLYEADIVSAYRFDRSGDNRRRLARTYLENHLVQAIFGLRLRDMGFAFKLVRRPVLEALDLQHKRSLHPIELLVRTHRNGFQIVQFGVDYFPRARRERRIHVNCDAVAHTVPDSRIRLRQRAIATPSPDAACHEMTQRTVPSHAGQSTDLARSSRPIGVDLTADLVPLDEPDA